MGGAWFASSTTILGRAAIHGCKGETPGSPDAVSPLQPGTTQLPPIVWQAQFPPDISACLLLACNPTGNINNSDFSWQPPSSQRTSLPSTLTSENKQVPTAWTITRPCTGRKKVPPPPPAHPLTCCGPKRLLSLLQCQQTLHPGPRKCYGREQVLSIISVDSPTCFSLQSKIPAADTLGFCLPKLAQACPCFLL
jgi:hypothetical protein